MADNADRRPRDSIARGIALVAIVLSLVALVWSMRAEKKADDALEKAGDSSLIVPTEDTGNEPELNPQTHPETNTGTDDAGGAGTGVNNNGATD